MSIADLRRDYRARALSEADAAADPLVFLLPWFDEAVRADVADADAMRLASAAADGPPDFRTVLL